jgi:hypothetical protein
LGLTYPILSDPTKATARAYGVLAASGYASRWTFYIGADGRILDIDKHVKSASHGADVVGRVQRSAFTVQGADSRSRSGSGSGSRHENANPNANENPEPEPGTGTLNPER